MFLVLIGTLGNPAAAHKEEAGTYQSEDGAGGFDGVFHYIFLCWGFCGIWLVWKQSGIISSASYMDDCRQNI
jgi:hypothetical protein